MNEVKQPGQAAATPLEIAAQVLSLEGMLLDEQRWDEWLALLTPDCEFWAPTWVTETQLASDPRRQLSHIYYASRAPLEDRILRITSGRAAAATPLRRSTHHMTNLVIESASAQEIAVRSALSCHSYDPHSKMQYTLFGWCRHQLRHTSEGWRIGRKKVALFNDTMPPSVDIYSF